MQKMLANSLLWWRKVWRRLRILALRGAFKAYGRNFLFDPDSLFTYATIEVGDDVSIGPGACLIASDSYIRIGSKVMFGPNVSILGGDHNTTEAGKFMYDIKWKRPENDQPVLIEDDVWIGANAIILKGVKIGRGCIVAAGAVVIHSTPPYTVIAGMPARATKVRFDLETILAHESRLYPVERRLTQEQLCAELGRFWTGENQCSSCKNHPLPHE